MPAQRKVFRIEESAQADVRVAISAAAPDDEAAQRHHELMTEVIALRALLNPRPQVRKQTPETCGVSETCNVHVCEAPEFKRELDLIYRAIRQIKQDMGGLEVSAFISPKIERVGRELDAVIAGTEQATQNILKSAEDIDQIANTLSAMLKGEYAQGLAQDIRDHVVRVFEACNFQDITGQRMNKVAATLKFIEDHIVRMMEIWRSIEQIAPVAPTAESNDSGENKFLNGPRLAGDSGHSSQTEIDVIFDSN
jgi:chemotaxis protein CheZ